MIETNMEKENNKNQKVPYSCDTNAKLVILLVIIGNLNSEIIIILTLSMKRWYVSLHYHKMQYDAYDKNDDGTNI